MKESTTLHSWADLKQYGINVLTGEADAYALRVLCDMNEEGVRLMTTYLGLVRAEDTFPKNMNSQVGEAEAVASMMIPRVLLPGVMVFALLHVGNYDYVMQSPTAFTGFNKGGKYVEGYLNRSQPEGWVLFHNERKARVADGSAIGDRNVHQFTGRTL